METKAKSPRWHIDALGVIRALENHMNGKKILEPSQVQAALTLLRKRLPDPALPKSKPAKKKNDDSDISLKDLK